MKFTTHILILVIALCLSPSLCLASDTLRVNPFTAFYLDSALGNRWLSNQSAETNSIEQRHHASVHLDSTLKSPNEAFLYSLVLPGTGQLYMGAKRGYLYAATELGLLATCFILRNTAVNTRDEYRDVVRQHVIFDGPGSFENWDPIEDFEHATQYENWNHVYDSEATRARTGKWYWADAKPFKDEPDVDIKFDSRYRLDAFELRQKANDTFERAKFFLGLTILNHVISAVEARITTKHWNLKQTQSKTLEIDVQTDVSAGALESVFVLRKRF